MTDSAIPVRLEVLRGVQVGERLPLPDAARVVVGRDAGVDVRLIGPQVSRRHFAIERSETGACRLRDLGSGNGTYLNGCRVLESELVDGDRIAVGDVECRFSGPSPTPSERTLLRLAAEGEADGSQVVADLAADALAPVGPESLPPARLAELATVCAEETRQDRLCHRALESCRAALGADRGALLLPLDPGSHAPSPVAVLHAPGDPPEVRLGIPASALQDLAARRRAVRLVGGGPRPQSAVVLGWPAGATGGAVLYLSRDAPPAPPYADRDLAAAAALAAIVAVALARVRASAQREDADARLRLLVDGADDLVFALDDEGRFTYANRAWLAGAEPSGSLGGRRLVELAPAHDHAGLLAAIDRALEEGASAVLETELRRGGDGFLPVRLHLAPLRNPLGTVVGVRGVARDHREILALRQAASGPVPAGTEAPAGQAPAPLDRAAIVGESAAMRDVRRHLADASRHERPVLLVGEGGTGKSALARAIHAGSARAAGPFVGCSCGALPEALLETALFGDPPGDGPSGFLAAAARGTLFLRDVHELPPRLQVRLCARLAAGDDGGATARVIAASPVMLEAREGLRAELRALLDADRIALPPLRDRREDLPPLVAHALNCAAEDGGRPLDVAPAAMERLLVYDWPGNVCELQAELTHAARMADGGVITLDNLSAGLRGLVDDLDIAGVAGPELLARVLDASRGDPDRAAALLGLPRSTLLRRLRESGLLAESPAA